ncbi:MAG: PRC-barrel domain-containing protein [Anaerolineales bacterium]|nr:PRC-barrel domain-containing protein [Anaerolineales bacterium]
MQTKMQFQKNANVMSASGHSVGQIDRIVVNPQNNVVTHLVVHQGGLFSKEDKVVPIEWVLETHPYEIVLCDEAGDLEALLTFEEEHIVDADDGSFIVEENRQPVMYGSPVQGLSLQPNPDENYVTKIDKNIPEGTVAMKEGAKVVTADGKHVGTVERVYTDIPEEQITHLLISYGMFSKKTKLVPIDWVENVTEDQVNLLVHKVSVDALTDTSILK